MIYNNIKKIYKKFLKKDYWGILGIQNFFHIRSNQNHNSIVSFLDNKINNINAIQLFITKKGLNFICDLLEITHFESSLLLEPEMLTICSIKKEELNENDKDYIRNLGCNVTKDNNIIVYSYQSGYNRRYANIYELEEIFEHLCFIESLLDQSFDEVMDNISKDLVNLVYFFMDTQKFYLSSERFLGVDSHSQFKPCFNALVDQYSEIIPVDDEGYLLMKHLPISIGSKYENPFLLIFYYPNAKKLYFDYSVSNIFNAKKDIYIPIDSAISKIGLPMELYINNRYLFASLSKTLNKLNVNSVFNPDIFDVNEEFPLNSILFKISETIDCCVTDYHYNSKKEAINILNLIVDRLNQISIDELFENDFDYEYNDDDYDSDSDEIN